MAAQVSPGPRFAGRRALVTGAAHGIGRATVRQLIAEGAHVTGVDPDGDALDVLASELDAFTPGTFTPGTFTPVIGDVSDTAGHEALLAAAAPDGDLHVLVNNAGVFLMGGRDATDHQWQRTLEVNVLGPARLTAAAADLMQGRPGAAVVNVASISGHVSQPGRWTYNGGKGATLSITRCQALDLAPLGIRVNSVSPGYVWTRVLDESAGGDRATWDEIWGRSNPLRRCAEPSEVATAICFLASDDASYITGTDLLVDGGLVSMSTDALTEFHFDDPAGS